MRFVKEKVPKVGRYLPHVDEAEARVDAVPYESILEVLDPFKAEMEKDDPLSNTFGKTKEAKNQMPAWVREKPGWAPIEMEVLIACGCDDDTAEHLMDKCMKLMKGRRPDYFPAAIMYHEFEGNMRNMYEQLESTSEDVNHWLQSRRADCNNMEPRQRKLESLASEQILPRPDEDHPMLMPLAPDDDNRSEGAPSSGVEGTDNNDTSLVGGEEPPRMLEN